MTNTGAVIKMEFSLLTSMIKSLLFMLGVILVLTFFMQNASFIQMMTMIYLLIFLGIPFQISEKSGVELLYASLGVSRRSAVLGRYVTGLISALAGMAFATLLPVVFGTAIDFDLTPAEALFTGSSFLLAFLFFASIQLPLFFKLGYANARLLSYAPLLLVFIVAVVVDNIIDLNAALAGLSGLSDFIDDHLILSALAALALGIILLGISALISCRIYAKKDL